MNKDNKIVRYRYTIIYFSVQKELNLKLNEYMVLDSILYYSKRNFYNKKLKPIIEKTGYSRNSIKRYIDKLCELEYISKIDGFTPKKDEYNAFNIHYDIEERMKPLEDSKYIKMYPNYRKELKLSDLEYCILYLIYSISKNTINKKCYAGLNFFSKTLFVKERNYYKVMEELLERNYIKKTGINKWLEADMFNWFKNQENMSNKAV